MRSVYDVLPLWLPAVCWHGGKWFNWFNSSLYPVVWHSDRGNVGYEKYYLHLIFTFYLNRDTSLPKLFPVVVFQLKIFSVLTAHAGLGIRQPCSISRDIVVNWQQKLSNFSSHTVNCLICNNHTIIDWMLLNFTPDIQQNCHQPGRKFEKSFCAVDRLSCQLELSKSETCQFRSDLVFDIVKHVHVIFLHGAKCCFEIFYEFRLLCC